MLTKRRYKHNEEQNGARREPKIKIIWDGMHIKA